MAKTTYLLYDDDCGICTRSANFFATILRRKIRILPMHYPEVEKWGIQQVGFHEYWLSFHIVKAGKITTELEAIEALAREFPLGSFLGPATKVPGIKNLLSRLLVFFQKQRKQECKVV